MLTIGQFSGHAHELKKRFRVTAIDAKEFFEHTAVLTFGQFSGHTHDLKKQFHVTVIGAKDFYEYTPGVLHANMKPAQLDALLKRRVEVRLIWDKRTSRLLIIGGQFSGYFFVREMKERAHVTVVGAKELFEHTPVLIMGGQFSGHADELKKRLHVTVICAKWLIEYTPANVKPAHLDAMLERRQLSRLFSARELKKRSHATFANTKGFFGYTPGVSHANVKPALDAVLERRQFPGLLLVRELKERLHVVAADTKGFSSTRLVCYAQT